MMIRDEGKEACLRGWELFTGEYGWVKILEIGILCYGNESDSLQHEQLDFV